MDGRGRLQGPASGLHHRRGRSASHLDPAPVRTGGSRAALRAMKEAVFSLVRRLSALAACYFAVLGVASFAYFNVHAESLPAKACLVAGGIALVYGAFQAHGRMGEWCGRRG